MTKATMAAFAAAAMALVLAAPGGVLAQAASGMLRRGEIATLLNWVEKLPSEILEANPWLCLYYATALTLTGQIQAVEPLFQTAEAQINKVPAGERMALLVEMAAMRAYIAARTGDIPAAIRLAQEALGSLPEEDLTVRCVVAYTLGNAYLLMRNTQEAARAFSEATQMGEAAGNIFLAAAATCGLSKIMSAQGSLHKAYDLLKQAEEMAARYGQNPSRMMEDGYAWLADLLRERNELEAAESLMVEHRRSCEQWRSTDAFVISSTVLARTQYAQGDMQGAINSLHSAQELAERYLIGAAYRCELEACLAWLWIASGNLVEAERHLEGRKSGAAGLPGRLQDLRQITLARLRFAQGKPAEALTLLRDLEEAARSQMLSGNLIGILTLEALAFRDLEQTAAALQALEEALELAMPEGYVRVFLDEGPALGELLVQASRKSKFEPLRNYIGELLRVSARGKVKQSLKPEALPRAVIPSPLIEALTGREIEILKLIAVGCSNQEIAENQSLEDALAELRGAEGAYQEARTRLHKHVIRAPFAGELGLRQVNVGQYVPAGQPIVEITLVDALELRFYLPQKDLPRLAAGQKVLGVVGRCEARFEGTLVAVDPRVDPATRMVGLQAAVKGEAGALHPGMAVRVRLLVDEIPDAILLPQEAIVRQGTKYVVYTVHAQNAAQPHEVTLGEFFLDGVHVTRGIAAGDRVIVSGQLKLQPGTPVAAQPWSTTQNPNVNAGRYGPPDCEAPKLWHHFATD